MFTDGLLYKGDTSTNAQGTDLEGGASRASKGQEALWPPVLSHLQQVDELTFLKAHRMGIDMCPVCVVNPSSVTRSQPSFGVNPVTLFG